MSCEDLLSVDYEVFGRVQGVFFRKYTQVSKKYCTIPSCCYYKKAHA